LRTQVRKTLFNSRNSDSKTFEVRVSQSEFLLDWANHLFLSLCTADFFNLAEKTLQYNHMVEVKYR